MLRYLVLSLILVLPSLSFGADAEGVTLADSTNLAGKELVLNGLGVRKATWFKVTVYVGGLYLESKSKDAASIISNGSTKKLVMHFVRAVGVDKLVNGWNEGFKNNGADFSKLGTKIKEFNSAMSDIEEGQQIVLDFIDDRVEVTFAGTKNATLNGEDFQRALLSIWLGSNPPNEELKQGMLGRS